MANNFRVLQTYDELGVLVYETVLDELLNDDPFVAPTHEEFMWAEPIAKKVKDRFLMNLDGDLE